MPVSFISEYAGDNVGKIIDSFLSENGVEQDILIIIKMVKQNLLWLFLMKEMMPIYTFYQDYPEKRLNIEFPELRKDDIILCGSIYAITEEIRKKFRN